MPPAVAPDLFRQACSHYGTGVTVVTSTGADGEPIGMTANSFTSVSLDPPLVLICVDYALATYRAIAARAAFAVHVLHSGQERLALRFARPGPGKFHDLSFASDDLGLPELDDYLVRFQCHLVNEESAGDHAIFVARVLDAKQHGANDAGALGFFRGSFVPFSQP